MLSSWKGVVLTDLIFKGIMTFEERALDKGTSVVLTDLIFKGIMTIGLLPILFSERNLGSNRPDLQRDYDLRLI